MKTVITETFMSMMTTIMASKKLKNAPILTYPEVLAALAKSVIFAAILLAR